MGTIQHKALVVTGADYNESRFTSAYKKAKKLFPDLISPRIKGLTNGYESFFIAPCGSKLGWSEDSNHDDSMRQLIEFLDTLKYEDGSTSVKYVYLTFGELGLTVEDYMGHDIYEEEN